MKRLVLVLALVALMLVPATALAWESLPDGATPVAVYWWNGSTWVIPPTNETGELARCWSSGGATGACNKQTWTVSFTNHAEVAQWINWSLGGTRWDWRIRKPGTYAADCIQAMVSSNDDVVITFSDFGNLAWDEEGNGILEEILTYYSVGPVTEGTDYPPTNWVTAGELNNLTITLQDSEGLHAGLRYKLWNKLQVQNCNSAGEYEDSGVITVALTNIAPWIDDNTGFFK